MIKPTIGRIVWYTPCDSDRVTLTQYDPEQKLAAIVTHVWGERCVNLAVFDSNGTVHQKTSVQLVQDGDPCNTLGGYAEWMPYQKGQAAKTEALEQKLATPA